MRIVNLKVIGGHEGLKQLGGVYCGRPGPLGNPFLEGKHGSREVVIDKFRRWLWLKLKHEDEQVIRAFEGLKADSVLGCWCSPQPCHCDVIVRAWQWWSSKKGV